MINERAWNEAKNILCVRLDTLGDVLMTTPAIRALKESCACRQITLLTSPAGAEVARLVPEIDAVLVYEAPWLKATPPRPDSRSEYAMAEELRHIGFDAAVIFTVYSQNPLPSAFLGYMADIPLRLAHCRENPYQLLTHWVPDHEPHKLLRHEVRRQLDLVATVGSQTGDERLSLRIPAGARGRVLRLLRDLGLDLKSPWVVVHPGVTAPSRRYPPESYAEVSRRLVTQLGCQVVFTGTRPETGLVAGIQAGMGVPSLSLVGRLNLGELAALIEAAPLLLANNTGPVHIAAAVGTPVVDIYALTNPQHTPWGVPNRVLFHDVPCKYCYQSVCPEGHHACLRQITPETVVRAAYELLAEAQVPQPVLEVVG